MNYVTGGIKLTLTLIKSRAKIKRLEAVLDKAKEASEGIDGDLAKMAAFMAVVADNIDLIVDDSTEIVEGIAGVFGYDVSYVTELLEQVKDAVAEGKTEIANSLQEEAVDMVSDLADGVVEDAVGSLLKGLIK